MSLLFDILECQSLTILQERSVLHFLTESQCYTMDLTQDVVKAHVLLFQAAGS